MMHWTMKKTVTTVAVAIGVCCQCLGLTAAGSRFDCTKPDHRDYTPGWTARHKSFNAIAAQGDLDLVFLGGMHGQVTAAASMWRCEIAATFRFA